MTFVYWHPILTSQSKIWRGLAHICCMCLSSLSYLHMKAFSMEAQTIDAGIWLFDSVKVFFRIVPYRQTGFKETLWYFTLPGSFICQARKMRTALECRCIFDAFVPKQVRYFRRLPLPMNKHKEVTPAVRYSLQKSTFIYLKEKLLWNNSMMIGE